MNKIHVVIGEQDEQFLVHLVNIMENGFKEYIEAHCFSKPEWAQGSWGRKTAVISATATICRC